MTKIYLGTVTKEPYADEVFLVPDLNAPVDEIRAALEQAEIARSEKQKRESEALARLFHLPDETKGLS